MANVQDFLSKEELQRFYEIDRWSIVRATLFTWGCIGAAIWGWAYTHHWAVLVIAFLVIGTRQHALHNLVHEASHYSISRNRALNDWLSDVFFAAPHLISTEGYRQRHLLHHSHLGDPHLDTELRPWFLIRRGAFLKQSAMALCGAAALQAAWSYRPGGGGTTSGSLRHPALVIVTNGVLWVFCWSLGVPFAYFYLWLLPLFTLTMYLDTLRVIVEHQTEDYAAGPENPDLELPSFTRSIPAGALERFVFGPINFCYHCEHHLVPGVPFAHLPALNKVLRDRGFFNQPDSRLGTSYLSVLSQLAWPRRSLKR